MARGVTTARRRPARYVGKLTWRRRCYSVSQWNSNKARATKPGFRRWAPIPHSFAVFARSGARELLFRINPIAETPARCRARGKWILIPGILIRESKGGSRKIYIYICTWATWASFQRPWRYHIRSDVRSVACEIQRSDLHGCYSAAAIIERIIVGQGMMKNDILNHDVRVTQRTPLSGNRTSCRASETAKLINSFSFYTRKRAIKCLILFPETCMTFFFFFILLPPFFTLISWLNMAAN